MKKLALATLVMATLPCFVTAQTVDDDLYYTSRRTRTTVAQRATTASDVDETPITTVVVRDRKGNTRDVDEYNRRYTSSQNNFTVEDGTLYIDEKEDADLTGTWVGDFDGSQDDYEYAVRIIRFRNPRYAIPVSSPLYWDIVYGLGYSWDWNVYEDGLYAYVFPTYTNRLWWNWRYAGYGLWGWNYWGWDYWGYAPYYRWAWGWHHPHYNWHAPMMAWNGRRNANINAFSTRGLMMQQANTRGLNTGRQNGTMQLGTRMGGASSSTTRYSGANGYRSNTGVSTSVVGQSARNGQSRVAVRDQQSGTTRQNTAVNSASTRTNTSTSVNTQGTTRSTSSYVRPNSTSQSSSTYSRPSSTRSSSSSSSSVTSSNTRSTTSSSSVRSSSSNMGRSGGGNMGGGRSSGGGHSGGGRR